MEKNLYINNFYIYNFKLDELAMFTNEFLPKTIDIS